MEPNVKCTKPHCNCVEIEERRTGGPVKMYPCLANAGQKNSLGDLKSMEERVKAFCQPDVMRGHRPDPLAAVGDIQKLRDDMAKLLDSGQIASRSGKDYSRGFVAALDKVLGIVSPAANGA